MTSPTTEDVRRFWVYGWGEGKPDPRVANAEFVAWLESVKAAAWQEGHESACEDIDYICARSHPNPYEKEQA